MTPHNHSFPTRRSSDLARDPHAEKRQHTSAGMALARRVLLRQDDVGPDWTRVAVPKTNSTLDCPGFNPDFSRDRKSTRLNSSHLGISYAVFCLKKKNSN